MRLHAFFAPFLIVDPGAVSPHDGFFTFESVPLKWHLPVGLLYDIYALAPTAGDPASDAPASSPSTAPSPAEALPLHFRLVLHFNPDAASRTVNVIQPSPIVLHDSFINSVKEADFLRSGTAKPIMSLGAAESKALWSSTQDNERATFAKIHASLLPAPGQFRNIPLRLYLPSSPSLDPCKAQIKVLQAHITPFVVVASSSTTSGPTPFRASPSPQPQTLGTALHQLLPNLFPSRRTPLLARPILHGAQVPMTAHLEELARWATYADGWLCVVIRMNS